MAYSYNIVTPGIHKQFNVNESLHFDEDIYQQKLDISKI